MSTGLKANDVNVPMNKTRFVTTHLTHERTRPERLLHDRKSKGAVDSGPATKKRKTGLQSSQPVASQGSFADVLERLHKDAADGSEGVFRVRLTATWS